MAGGGKAGGGGGGVGAGRRLWAADNPSKRWGEAFLLWYSPFWIVWALGIVVGLRLYEGFGKAEYMAVGLFAAVPCFTLPLIIVGKADRNLPIHRRWWVKVPIPLYFLTHAYFCFYHSLSNIVLRRVDRWFVSDNKSKPNAAASSWQRSVVFALVVFALSYATAFMETLTIAHFPYYTFTDKSAMYKWGSLFYAIYFFVSFPMFYRMEEKVGEEWTVGAAALDSLAAGMLVTILLDFWRLYVGRIADPFHHDHHLLGNTAEPGLPWLPS
eukprot:jgi/Chlat1/4191/Chrsp27S04286